MGPASAAHAQIDGSWTGVWEGNPNIRQVRIGDGVTTGPNVRIMRGLLASNQAVGLVARRNVMLVCHRGGRLASERDSRVRRRARDIMPEASGVFANRATFR